MTETPLFPNILVLSDEGPQTSTAGGLLLHRLLKDHPPRKLRVLARQVPPPEKALPGVPYQKLLIPWHRFESSRFHRLKRSLRAWNLTPTASCSHIDRLLDDFSPDVVVCVMQHAQYYDSAAKYALHRNIPFVVLVHDINDEFEPVYGVAQEASRQKDGLFYRSAASRLCISPEMERHCSKVYGVAGEVLYPNRDELLQPRALDQASHLRNPLRLTIGFAGNLNYGYGKGVLQLLPALKSAGARLIIYGQLPGPDLLPFFHDSETCEFRGFLPSNKAWDGIKADCDAVWLPYPDPAGPMECLYRHHFPSKLPEYLALGMPVIVSGPAYATGVRWGLQNPDACIAFTGSENDFIQVLNNLAADSEWRMTLSGNALASGDRDFNPKAIKKHFYQTLESCLQVPK